MSIFFFKIIIIIITLQINTNFNLCGMSMLEINIMTTSGDYNFVFLIYNFYCGDKYYYCIIIT